MAFEKWKRENFIFPNGNRRLSPGFEQKSPERFEHADYVNLGWRVYWRVFQVGAVTRQRHAEAYFYEGFVLYGAGTRSRTRDLLITSQLLYQLSYTGVLGRRL